MTTTVLKIICMVCHKPMGEKDGEGIEGVTSSICPKCALDYYGIKLEEKR